jgi:hypothetical protein
MLPYLTASDGKTVYEHFTNQPKLLTR